MCVPCFVLENVSDVSVMFRVLSGVCCFVCVVQVLLCSVRCAVFIARLVLCRFCCFCCCCVWFELFLAVGHCAVCVAYCAECVVRCVVCVAVFVSCAL